MYVLNWQCKSVIAPLSMIIRSFNLYIAKWTLEQTSSDHSRYPLFSWHVLLLNTCVVYFIFVFEKCVTLHGTRVISKPYVMHFICPCKMNSAVLYLVSFSKLRINRRTKHKQVCTHFSKKKS